MEWTTSVHPILVGTCSKVEILIWCGPKPRTGTWDQGRFARIVWLVGRGQDSLRGQSVVTYVGSSPDTKRVLWVPTLRRRSPACGWCPADESPPVRASRGLTLRVRRWVTCRPRSPFGSFDDDDYRDWRGKRSDGSSPSPVRSWVFPTLRDLRTWDLRSSRHWERSRLGEMSPPGRVPT